MDDSENKYAGWIDYSIAELIESSMVTRLFPYSLVTCVDSSRDLNLLDTTRKIIKEFSDCYLQSHSLFVPCSLLPIIHNKYSLFNGFDEIWFYTTIPSGMFPEEYWITGPREIANDLPSGIYEWMISNFSMLGIGDGTGLNYVTISLEISKKIQDIVK